jgi:hypothetical protein
VTYPFIFDKLVYAWGVYLARDYSIILTRIKGVLNMGKSNKIIWTGAEIVESIKNEPKGRQLLRYSRLNGAECVGVQNDVKLTILYNHIMNNAKNGYVKINKTMYNIERLKVGYHSNNTREKTTPTFCIDFDIMGVLSLYVRKWYYKSRSFRYTKIAPITQLKVNV